MVNFSKSKMAKNKILQPQEIEVFYVIPSLRKHLAAHMKAKGLKQKQIAKLLQIEDAAVSQYLSNKRGDKIKLEKNILEEVKKSADLITDEISMLREMQRLLRVIRMTGALCKVHKQLSSAPLECGPEFVGCSEDNQNFNENVPNTRILN